VTSIGSLARGFRLAPDVGEKINERQCPMNWKKILAGVAIFTFAVVVCLAEQSLVGGYAKATVTEKEVVAAATFAVKAQHQVMSDAGTGQPMTLELVKIVVAEQQVVAGMNYRLTLKVKVHGKEKEAEAVVWWQAWRKPAPYQLTSWKWADK